MVDGPNYGLLTSEPELEERVQALLAEGRPFGFDIETGYDGDPREEAQLHPEENLIAGLSLTNSVRWARYIPVRHDSGTNLDPEFVARTIWPLMASGLGVPHGGQFELRCMAREFRELVPEAEASCGYFPIRSDTMLEAHAEGCHKTLALKPLTLATFGHQMAEIMSLFPEKLTQKERNSIRFSVLDQHDPAVYEYACEDSLWTLGHHLKRYPHISTSLVYKMEMGILPIVCAMEEFGLQYDWLYMRDGAQRGRAFQEKLALEISADLTELLGEPVKLNLASPKQVADVLYDKLKLPVKRRSRKTNNPSTDKIALKGLSQRHPIVQKMINWRQLAKLCGTYLEVYEKKFSYAPDGRTHPHHMQCGVPAGRFAVSGPPYQQCLPGDYEVLTADGWTRLDCLADGEDVVQYLPDGQMEFVVPTQVTRQSYKGEMVELRSVEGGVWQYTPNHRIVYRKRRKSGVSPVMELTAAAWADALLAKQTSAQGRRLCDHRMIKAGFVAGGWGPEGLDLTLLRLAVACQADGHRRSDGPHGQVWYDVELRSARKQQRFAELASGLLGIREVGSARGRRWRVDGQIISDWIDHDKNFRPHSVLSLSVGGLREFLAEVMAWDGDFTRHRTFGQKTTRRRSVDVVQAAAALSGQATSLYERPEYDAVTVNLWDRAEKEAGWQEPVQVPSPGMVYCVTVPSGMFLARNPQGKVQVTGNSPKKYHYELVASGETFDFNFRNAIVCPPGYYGLGFDYSQIELRVIAGEAGETSLLEVFAAGGDPHSLTASLMLGIPMEQIDDEEHRPIGKTMNFALMYQMGVDGLADRLGISKDEAQALFDQYFAAYSRIKGWIDQTVTSALRNGYIMTRFGRRVPIWEFERAERWIRKEGERLAGNAPIQGGAADYMKLAMIRADQALRKTGLTQRGVRLVMNIHDALEWYVPSVIRPEEIIRALTLPGVVDASPAILFPVEGWPPMEAEWHAWKRWGSAKELEIGADGSVAIRGERVEEALPGDEDEEGPALPAVDLEAMRRARGAAPPPVPPVPAPARVEAGGGGPGDRPRGVRAPYAGPARTVIIEAARPLPDQFRELLGLVETTPGPNTVILRMPDGDVPFRQSCGLSPDHEADVALLLGAARVHYDAASVDPAVVAAGLDL